MHKRSFGRLGRVHKSVLVPPEGLWRRSAEVCNCKSYMTIWQSTGSVVGGEMVRRGAVPVKGARKGYIVPVKGTRKVSSIRSLPNIRPHTLVSSDRVKNKTTHPFLKLLSARHESPYTFPV